MNKELIDQSLHVLLAVTWFFLFTHSLNWWQAFFFVMLFAVLRELDQHAWDWRSMGRLDLTFFAIGAALAALFF